MSEQLRAPAMGTVQVQVLQSVRSLHTGSGRIEHSRAGEYDVPPHVLLLHWQMLPFQVGLLKPDGQTPLLSQVVASQATATTSQHGWALARVFAAIVFPNTHNPCHLRGHPA